MNFSRTLYIFTHSHFCTHAPIFVITYVHTYTFSAIKIDWQIKLEYFTFAKFCDNIYKKYAAILFCQHFYGIANNNVKVAIHCEYFQFEDNISQTFYIRSISYYCNIQLLVPTVTSDITNIDLLILCYKFCSEFHQNTLTNRLNHEQVKC